MSKQAPKLPTNDKRQSKAFCKEDVAHQDLTFMLLVALNITSACCWYGYGLDEAGCACSLARMVSDQGCLVQPINTGQQVHISQSLEVQPSHVRRQNISDLLVVPQGQQTMFPLYLKGIEEGTPPPHNSEDLGMPRQGHSKDTSKKQHTCFTRTSS